MCVFRILGLIQLICAVQVLASSPVSSDQSGPVSSLEEVDEVALLQLQVQPANVSRVSDLPMMSWVVADQSGPVSSLEEVDEADKKKLTESVTDLQARVKAQPSDQPDLHSQLASLKEEKSKLSETVTQLQAKEELMQSKVTSLEAAKKTLSENVTDLEAKLKSQPAEKLDLESKVKSLEAEKTKLSETVTHLQAKLKSQPANADGDKAKTAEKDDDDDSEKVSLLEAEKKKLSDTATELRAKVSSLLAEASSKATNEYKTEQDLKDQLSSLENNVTSKTAANRKLSETVEELQSKITSLEADANAKVVADQSSPVSSLEEVDEVALLQLQVQPAKVPRVSDQPMTSWVVAFPRSSSSTTQALIAEVGDAIIPGLEFTLFEPCQTGDEIENFTNCSDLLDQIIHCDFSKVNSLHYWNVKFQGVVSCCQEPYSPEGATQHCLQATTHTFKTVAVHDLEREVFPVLDDTPKLRVVNLVRDPRGMYISNKKFGRQLEVYFPVHGGIVNNDAHHRIGGEWPERLDRLRLTCAYTANQANVSHPRILHVRFEDMISQPDAPRKTLQFLGFPWNLEVEETASRYYPGLTPGTTWAHIDHYPGDEDDWTSGELEVLDDIECQSAFRNWGYPAHPDGIGRHLSTLATVHAL